MTGLKFSPMAKAKKVLKPIKSNQLVTYTANCTAVNVHQR